MPKKLFKRFFPDHRKVREHKSLRFFGTLLHDPNLWHLNRRSVAGAFSIGLFIAFMPVPFQMVIAAALAIGFRVNLPIAVALVWTTNPLTIPPIFVFAYKLGQWVLDTPPVDIDFQLSFEWLMTDMLRIWQPFLLGCLMLGSFASAFGYIGIRLFWRFNIIMHYRRKRRKALQRRRPDQESE